MSSGNSAGSPAPNKLSDKDASLLKKLIYNFFVKAASLINDSRVTHDNLDKDDDGDSNVPQLNTWFNISTDISNIPKSVLHPWKSSNLQNLPPMVVETVLDLRDKDPKHLLYLKDKDSNAWLAMSQKNSTKSEVVLERWYFSLRPSTNFTDFILDSDNDDPLMVIYRHCILLFRDLYTYINVLPAATLKANIEAYNENETSQTQFTDISYRDLKIATKIRNGLEPISKKGRIGLSKEIISTYSNVANESGTHAHLEEHTFKSITTPYGNLVINVQYRKDCDFYLQSPESITSPQHPAMTQNDSSSNVSLAALLRDRQNSLKKSKAIPIPASETGTVTPNATGTLPQPVPQVSSHSPSASAMAQKYISSFGSRNTVAGRSLMATTPQSSYSVSRNTSLQARRLSDLEPPSQLNIDEDINDFIRSVDNKKDFKLGQSTTNLSESLFKFKHMRNSSILGESADVSYHGKLGTSFSSRNNSFVNRSPTLANQQLVASTRSPMVPYYNQFGASYDPRSYENVSIRSGNNNNFSNNNMYQYSNSSGSSNKQLLLNYSPQTQYSPRSITYRNDYDLDYNSLPVRPNNLLQTPGSGHDAEPLGAGSFPNTANDLKLVRTKSLKNSFMHLPSLQKKNVSQPITTTENAYAKMNEQGLGIGYREPEEEKDIDDELIFPVHDV